MQNDDEKLDVDETKRELVEALFRMLYNDVECIFSIAKEGEDVEAEFTVSMPNLGDDVVGYCRIETLPRSHETIRRLHDEIDDEFDK